MDLDEKELERLTKLSHIDCTGSEKNEILANLSKILSYVEQLEELDLSDVEPCHHIFPHITNVLRKDEPQATLSREEFLANSPAHISGMIRVPTVIQKDQ